MENLNNSSSVILDLIPVILSGGSGSRLWPLSRECYPKQYLNIEDKNKYSMIQNTFLRLKGLKNLSPPIIICNQEQRFIVAEQMRAINTKPKSILLEPFGRNTAPAITLAALEAYKNNKDALLLILSSDHQINNEVQFRKTIEDGIFFAKEGRLVNFGVLPRGPETGYGYIESYEELSKDNKSSSIKKFIEKPDIETAKILIKDNHFVWNSGIFLFKASAILNELKRLEPKIVELCTESLNKGEKDLDFFRIKEESFKKCSNVPIDIAVMEQTKLGTVLNLDAGWNDIGSWKSLWENSKKNLDGNILKGKVLIKESKNCYFRSEHRLIVGIGLENIIIIETDDAVLISNKNSTNKIKNIVIELNKNDLTEGKYNKKLFRPWGSFTSIEKGSTWQVKKLEIKPNESLSLQLHNHRSEHWVVVKGSAKVEIDSKITFLNENESIYVPLGSKHRLSNPNNTELVLIEVQSGNYLGEDDILRFDDKYGRKIK